MLVVGGCVCALGCMLVQMKIISYNARGLGGFEKRNEV